MLGGIKADRGWNWSAYGKHPAAKDYFRIGRDVPLASAFSVWVERGYARFAAKGRPLNPPASWRFWTRESVEGRMACGILKDSADAVGRPYPLLIMGSGPAPGWENHWELAPSACEAAWTQMEYISARSIADVKSLEAEIQKMNAPSVDWRDLEEKRKSVKESGLEALKNRVRHLSGENPILCLDGELHEDFDLIDACHRFLRAESINPPNAVFMGGIALHTYLAVFRRALTESDFMRLWSLSDEKTAVIN
jgi:type VI secretion system protein VasJ